MHNKNEEEGEFGWAAKSSKESSTKKNEAVPPQHYLSPNQIKPNYSLKICAPKIKPLCVNFTTSGTFIFYKHGKS